MKRENNLNEARISGHFGNHLHHFTSLYHIIVICQHLRGDSFSQFFTIPHSATPPTTTDALLAVKNKIDLTRISLQNLANFLFCIFSWPHHRLRDAFFSLVRSYNFSLTPQKDIAKTANDLAHCGFLFLFFSHFVCAFVFVPARMLVMLDGL